MSAKHKVLEATIINTEKMAATVPASKLQKGNYLLLKNTNIAVRENVSYLKMQADTVKVNLIVTYSCTAHFLFIIVSKLFRMSYSTR